MFGRTQCLIICVGEIGATYPVPEGKEGAVVPHVVRVVVVMDVCPRAKREIPEGHKPEVVARVSINTLNESYRQPDPKGLDVASQQEGAQKHGQSVGKDVFSWVEELHC